MNNTLSNFSQSKKFFSYKYGLLAGGLMSTILILFQLTGNDYRPFIKLVKYIPLIAVLAIALSIYKARYKKRIFFTGMGLGFKMSTISGIVIVGLNILLYAINPEWSFSKYGLEPHALSELALISTILFFETLVFGSIISFIILQYLKEGGVNYE